MKTITNNLDHVLDRVRTGAVAEKDALADLHAIWGSQEKHTRVAELETAKRLFGIEAHDGIDARIALIMERS